MGREGNPFRRGFNAQALPSLRDAVPPQTPPTLPELSSAGFDTQCVFWTVLRGVTRDGLRMGDQTRLRKVLGWGGGRGGICYRVRLSQLFGGRGADGAFWGAPSLRSVKICTEGVLEQCTVQQKSLPLGGGRKTASSLSRQRRRRAGGRR